METSPLIAELLPLQVPEQVPGHDRHGRQHVQHRPDRVDGHPGGAETRRLSAAQVEALRHEMRCQQDGGSQLPVPGIPVESSSSA